MKTIKHLISLIVYSVLIFSASSCLENEYQTIISTPVIDGFIYNTTNDYNVTIKALNNANEPMTGVYIELYTQNPLLEDGSLIENSEQYLIFKGITKSTGQMDCSISPATSVDSLHVLVNQIGLPSYFSVKLNSSSISLVIGGTDSKQDVISKIASNVSQVIPTPTWTVNHDFLKLGSWNNSGLPNYLTSSRDVISSDFLADINASLPERIQLPDSHPEYLSSEDDGSLVLIEDAEVWVTFVHEGAGFVNTLAYYSYPTSLAPTSKTDIKYPIVIFPNVSFWNSGGGLTSGDKVQLFYYNETKGEYSNVFPAGTTVAWIFRSNGWDAANYNIQAGYFTYYSDKRFNPEKNDINKKHNIVLKDNSRQLYLIGFEDLNREQSADNDFNDGVFYATVSPYTAVESTNYKIIDSPTDTDNDGVGDTNDEYPDDPKKAFNNYYPAQNVEGTLAFEDLWPNRGDYDFNDLVVDYNFNQITNADNDVTAVNAKLTVRAIGASYKNGFGIQFNTSSTNVLSVTGQKITENYLSLASNGTENSEENAVIFAFDNAFSVLPHPGNVATVNTISGSTYQTPGIINLNIEFVNPVDYSQFGTPPYNPFIVIDGQRGREVHLPACIPTSLVDLNLLGVGDDSSDPTTGKYYMSNKYLPWAVNFPVKFDYPSEKQDITKAFLNFNNWVESSGFNYMDWYLDKTGYRNSDLIYQK
ncbi:MAG: LruC domain-containing protein [Paludibacter sp.]|nr:LruC domain-containing protein [Paludibacter sp.]